MNLGFFSLFSKLKKNDLNDTLSNYVSEMLQEMHLGRWFRAYHTASPLPLIKSLWRRRSPLSSLLRTHIAVQICNIIWSDASPLTVPVRGSCAQPYIALHISHGVWRPPPLFLRIESLRMD